MTKTINIEETEYPGAMTQRFVEVDITNYDDDGSGDGESFVPADVSMRRFQDVQPKVIDGTGYVAQYDESTGAIRLFQSAGAAGEMAEVGSNSNNAATLRVTVLGR